MKKLLYLLLFLPFTLWAQGLLTRLEESPRHHEWVTTKNGDQNVRAFLVFPEVCEKGPVIYEVAGHGFFRTSEAKEATEANKKGSEKGMKRLIILLAKL